MEKIYVPFEVFRKLPVEEADKIQNDLMNIYFKDNPDALRSIIDRSEGDGDLVEVYKEDEFNKIMTRDYAYDTNILRRRKNDPIANRLVELIDNFNLQISEPRNEEF
jgi:hypothetical protein